MTKKEYEILMNLILCYGDACEAFGDYCDTENSEACYDARKEIEDFLKKFVKEA